MHQASLIYDLFLWPTSAGQDSVQRVPGLPAQPLAALGAPVLL